MRILLDECVNARVRAAFPGHVVRTVAQMGWRGSKDAALLKFADQNFDIFVTIDGKIERQHDLTGLRLGTIPVHVPDNTLQAYEPLFRQLLAAVEKLHAGEVLHIPQLAA